MAHAHGPALPPLGDLHDVGGAQRPHAGVALEARADARPTLAGEADGGGVGHPRHVVGDVGQPRPHRRGRRVDGGVDLDAAHGSVAGRSAGPCPRAGARDQRRATGHGRRGVHGPAGDRGGVGGRLLHRDPQHLERGGTSHQGLGPRRRQVAALGPVVGAELAAAAAGGPRRRGRRLAIPSRPEATSRTISLSRSTRAGSLASTDVQSPVAGRGQPHVGRRGPHHRHAGLGERVGQVVELLAQPGVVHRVAQRGPTGGRSPARPGRPRRARRRSHRGWRRRAGGAGGDRSRCTPCPRPPSRPRGAPDPGPPRGQSVVTCVAGGPAGRGGRRSRPRTRGPGSRPASRRPGRSMPPRRRPVTTTSSSPAPFPPSIARLTPRGGCWGRANAAAPTTTTTRTSAIARRGGDSRARRSGRSSP